MEGPTPVSALIHAATMVTAGVFLLIRLYFFFVLADSVNTFIVFIGTLTTFFAASVALVQNDIKKIVAYSTCSQLGYMITACGFQLYGFAFYHLVTHAFFKALLFLCAGSVIHAVLDEQDIRKMGGLALKLPITFFCMLIGSLSLAGFPFLSGFYSKESILETILSLGTSLSFFAYFFGIISVFFTTFYSFRLLFLVFFSSPNGFSTVYKNIHRTSFFIFFPLIVLAFLSIFLGKWTFSFFLSLNINFFTKTFFGGPFFVLLPMILFFLATILAVFFYLMSFRFSFFLFDSNFLRFLYGFLNKKWYVDTFYNYFLSRFTFIFSFNISFLSLEKGWIEFFGPSGISNFSFFFSSFLLKFQTARYNDYLLYSIFFVCFLLLI
jgi:NADH:ubiquinone oxidoreductase subunit 5 (subunit L)/multisubunit Na+/H+ antiporter MnhA subunit